MRRLAKQQEDNGAEIDLTPMLDVVFIMLIFFIVVASFIKEAGVEVNRPDDNQQTDPEDSVSIVVEVAADNQIWMENRRVDVRAVRANIQRLLAEDPEAPVTVKVEKLNPNVVLAYYGTHELTGIGHELTALRFTIDESGNVGNLSSRPKALVVKAAKSG